MDRQIQWLDYSGVYTAVLVFAFRNVVSNILYIFLKLNCIFKKFVVFCLP